MTADHSGPSISTADPIAAGYSAGASAVNGATLAARPGDAPGVLAEQPLPISDAEFAERLVALDAAQGAVLIALATLRDTDAASRLGARLDEATDLAWRAGRELGIEVNRLADRGVMLLDDDGWTRPD